MKMDHRQRRAYEALQELDGLREIRGPEHHPWIVKSWQVVGASWYDTDEDAWCGATVGRVLKEAGLPILPGGMSVQARAWHEKDWGKRVPLEEAPEGAVVVLKHHVGFLHSLVWKNGNITGIRMWGGNQSNGINLKTYPYTDKGRLQFLSARIWPAENIPERSLEEKKQRAATRMAGAGFLRALWRAVGRLLGGKA